MSGASAWHITDNGLRLRVRATPRAGRDRLDGLLDLPDGPALKIAVSAPPEGGKANAAIIELLAKFFATAKSNIAVASGASSRLKQIDIAGDGASLAAVLEAWAAAEPRGDGKQERNG